MEPAHTRGYTYIKPQHAVIGVHHKYMCTIILTVLPPMPISLIQILYRSLPGDRSTCTVIEYPYCNL